MQKSEITLVIGNGVLRSFGTGTLSRGVVNNLELTFIDKDKNAIDFTDIARWEAVVTQDYLRETLPLLSTDESERININIISLIIPEDSTELSDVIDGRKSIQAFVTIFGRNAVDDIVKAYTFPVILLNMGISYADIAENSLSNLFYSKEQIDKKEKAIYKAIDEIDTGGESYSDISELTDNQGILDAKEDKSSKTASINKQDASGIKYPSESAVVNFVETEISGIDIPEGLTLEQVKTGLNIDEQDGSKLKYLSEKNTVESLPAIPEQITVSDVKAALNLDEATGLKTRYVSEKNTIEDLPTQITIADVKTGLGIDASAGDPAKVLNQKDQWVELPEGGGGGVTISEVKQALNIDEQDGLTTNYLSEKNTIESLPAIPTQYTDADARAAVGIDTDSGLADKYISEKGTAENLPAQITVGDVKTALGISDLGSETDYVSGKGTIKTLPTIPDQDDIRSAVGIDLDSGDPNKAIMADGGQKTLPTQYTDSDAKEAIGIDPLDETGNVLSKNGAWITVSSGGGSGGGLTEEDVIGLILMFT